uniref:Rho-GAP domain-containing protein n=1 Tax=Glossina brevipalpis TaxID=37001 RepID=A0A1A9WRD8_9MUSC
MAQQPPSTVSILIAKANLTSANERRTTTANTANTANNTNTKSIMHCLRDRTPSYKRSNSQINITRDGGQKFVQQLPKESHRTNVKPCKLTLLKSSSSRDLTQLKELKTMRISPLATNIKMISNSVSNSHCATSSPSSSTSTSKSTSTSTTTTTSASTSTSSSSSSPSLASASASTSSAISITMNGGHCSFINCQQRILNLEQRVTVLEAQLNAQCLLNKTMANRLEELNKRYADLQDQNLQNKRKKSASLRHNCNKKETEHRPIHGTVQPSKFVAWMKLSNFWKQRPSIQTLKEQNIYNDEPCFDTEIEMVLKDDLHKTVPKIVVDCCQLIEEKYRKSPEPVEGIYRQCGDYNKIQALRFSIDANNYESLRQSNIDIHTLTGVLKLFLREIKSPLISVNEAKTFIGKPNQWLLTDLPAKLEILKRLIRSLPEVNRDTMEYLFSHFNKLTKVPLQQISADSLSLSVTPSIFHTVQQGAHIQDIHLLLKESEILADCVKIMIEYHSKIFE